MKTTVILLLIVLAFVLGWTVGVKHYQNQCEMLGWQGSKWLECEL